MFRNAIPDGAADADERVHLIVTLCVGGMVLARTTHDPGLRETLRATARKQALELLGRDDEATTPGPRTRRDPAS